VKETLFVPQVITNKMVTAGRALPQAVIRWPLTEVARVKARIGYVRFAVEKMGLGLVLHRVLRSFLCHNYFTVAKC
jgi:hypothetical protein